MNQSSKLILILLLITQIIVPAIIYVSFTQSTSNTSESIVLRARAPENGGWDIKNITVVGNQPIDFTFISEDVTHSFFIYEYDINIRIYPGKPVHTTITFDSPGLYSFLCHVDCGDYHLVMNGFLEVLSP